MLDDLNGDQMRPPSRQKEPSCALGISSDEDNGGYPSEKIILTSGVPGKSHGRQRSKEFRDSDSNEESHANPKFRVNKRFESDDEQNEEYEQIGDLSDESSEEDQNSIDLQEKERFNKIAIDQIDEMEGVDPNQLNEEKETQQREYNA